MTTRISKIALTLSVFLIWGIAFLPSKASAYGSTNQTAVPCQCVIYVQNRLFGGHVPGNGPDNGSWLYANELANQSYWDFAYNNKWAGLYKQVNNPATAQAGDVIIMQPTANVYVQMPGGNWTPARSSQGIGYGSGHIGFVLSASYYNNNFAMKNLGGMKNLSGWQITMQSANWATQYYSRNGMAFSDTNVFNPFSTTGGFMSGNGCSNVTNSWIFLPTGNPVSFWRLQK